MEVLIFTKQVETMSQVLSFSTLCVKESLELCVPGSGTFFYVLVSNAPQALLFAKMSCPTIFEEITRI